MKVISQFILFILSLSSITGNSQSNSTLNKSIEKGLLQNQEINISNTTRNYHLFVPENPTNAPVVVLLHGNRSSNDQLIGLKGAKAPYKVWLDIAERENIILAIPNGKRGSNNHRGWNDCRNDAKTNPNEDDVLFISALIDHMITTYDANADKVYALGTSNGGHMAIRLAQEIPEKLTAFGAVVAASPVNSKCTESNLPISALFINGTRDPILPFEGGQMKSNRGEVFSAENTIAYWINRNQTDTRPIITAIPDNNTSDDSNIEKQDYKNGTNNTEVTFYKVINGGHTEPSILQRLRKFFLRFVGNQNGDVEMAEEVWTFFKDKTKKATVTTPIPETSSQDLNPQSLTWQDRERKYWLHLPPKEKMDKAMPILFDLHGGGGTGKGTPGLVYNRFNELADRDGFIVVYPDAVSRNWNDGRTENLKPKNKDVDDVGFIVEIINRLKSTYNIDADRIFTTGISNGGFMSSRLLCDRADLFRGGAIVTASLAEVYLPQCNPEKPVAVMVFNGTDDPLVPYHGGEIQVFKGGKTRGKIISTDDYLAFWKERNGCENQEPTIELPNKNKWDGTTVAITTYTNCETGGALKFFKIIGGGHTWPGGKQYLRKKLVGNTSQEINACDEIWNYFKSLE